MDTSIGIILSDVSLCMLIIIHLIILRCGDPSLWTDLIANTQNGHCIHGWWSNQCSSNLNLVTSARLRKECYNRKELFFVEYALSLWLWHVFLHFRLLLLGEVQAAMDYNPIKVEEWWLAWSFASDEMFIMPGLYYIYASHWLASFEELCLFMVSCKRVVRWE